MNEAQENVAQEIVDELAERLKATETDGIYCLAIGRPSGLIGRILSAATNTDGWGTDPVSLVCKSLSFRANDLMSYANGEPLHTGRGMAEEQATAEQVAIDAVLGMLNRGELVIEKRASKPEPQAPASDDVARYLEWVRQGHHDGIISASRDAGAVGRRADANPARWRPCPLAGDEEIIRWQTPHNRRLRTGVHLFHGLRNE